MRALVGRFRFPRRFDSKGSGYVSRLSHAYLMESSRVWGPAAATGRVILGAPRKAPAWRSARRKKHRHEHGLTSDGRIGDSNPARVISIQASRISRANRKAHTNSFYEMVNHESGLLGVSETSSDMRPARREKDDGRAAEAVALFCYRRRSGLARSPLLSRLDTLVFSAGIGETARHPRTHLR